MIVNAWFISCLAPLLVCLLVCLASHVRHKMLTASLWTMLFGLTELLFVSEYCTPSSLFNLAERTQFDMESLLFSFAIGSADA